MLINFIYNSIIKNVFSSKRSKGHLGHVPPAGSVRPCRFRSADMIQSGHGVREGFWRVRAALINTLWIIFIYYYWLVDY